jgi:hypothetical protein
LIFSTNHNCNILPCLFLNNVILLYYCRKLWLFILGNRFFIIKSSEKFFVLLHLISLNEFFISSFSAPKTNKPSWFTTVIASFALLNLSSFQWTKWILKIYKWMKNEFIIWVYKRVLKKKLWYKLKPINCMFRAFIVFSLV